MAQRGMNRPGNGLSRQDASWWHEWPIRGKSGDWRLRYTRETNWGWYERVIERQSEGSAQFKGIVYVLHQFETTTIMAVVGYSSGWMRRGARRYNDSRAVTLGLPRLQLRGEMVTTWCNREGRRPPWRWSSSHIAAQVGTTNWAVTGPKLIPTPRSFIASSYPCATEHESQRRHGSRHGDHRWWDAPHLWSFSDTIPWRSSSVILTGQLEELYSSIFMWGATNPTVSKLLL
jgi:hypothetical protein